jgi:tripartite-type tricarboxylate transporter receptor subunit TctC
LNRRHALLALAGAPLAARSLSTPALAAGFPERPLRFICPYAPGGNADLTARILSPRMSEHLGQPVIVENRAGAGGSVAALQVARMRADGYTFMLGSNGPLSVNPVLQRNLGYDPLADFAPIGMALRTPQCVVVHKDFPARSLAEFIALGKARPGTISTGSSGIGSTSHLSIEAFNGLTGAALQHVPYGSGGAMAPDLVAGNINAAITEISTALPLHRAGQARILAVGTARRMGLAPEVPTFAEGGVANFRPAAYLGIVFPPNPPAEAMAALHAALTATLADAAVRQRIEQAGSEPAGAEEASPAGFAAFLKAELETTRAAAEKAGLRPA